MSGLSFRSGLKLTPLMRRLCEVSILATRQLAVLPKAKAAFWSEYGAQKGESSFLLGIRSLSMYIDAIPWCVPGGAARIAQTVR